MANLIHEPQTQTDRKSGIKYYWSNGDTVGYVHPHLWSDRLPIGIVGVVPKEPKPDRLIADITRLQQDLIYTSPLDVFTDLASADTNKAVTAVRYLHDIYRKFFTGMNFYLVYFVDAKGHTYNIPLSLVMATSFESTNFNSNALLYSNGRPQVAVTAIEEKPQIVSTSEGEVLELSDRLIIPFSKQLGSVRIRVNDFIISEMTYPAVIKPAKGIGLNGLEGIVNK